jgi:type IV pilus assembly protein PilF
LLRIRGTGGTLSRAAVAVIGVACATCVWARTSPDKRDEALRYYRLGQVQIDQGKTLQAIEAVNKALKLDPENAEAHYLLGFIRYQQSEYKLAEKEFRKALKLNPYYTDAHNHLGLVYREMKDYDEALSEFRAALNDKSYKSPERIHLNIGYLYLARSMYPEAIASFQKAVALSPAYLRGRLGLGTAYAQAGQKDLADKELRKVVSLGPDSPEAAEARQLLERKVKQAGS